MTFIDPVASVGCSGAKIGMRCPATGFCEYDWVHVIYPIFDTLRVWPGLLELNTGTVTGVSPTNLPSNTTSAPLGLEPTW